MNDVIERILVTEEEIIKRSKELGAVITQDYRDAGKTPIVVGLLKGSVPFLAEIMKHIDLDIEIDFMDVSSYDGAQSVGDVKINKDLDKSVKGESILLVEDIVDTGRTLKEVKKLLLHKGAADVKIVSLLDKPSRRVIEIQADYVGFEIPNEFVVGYGLDYDQKYRNLPYIGVLRPQVYENR
ncbi:MAG: hypoxanthine phosphoribosyltransferase [Merdibacter sp.]|nr:hypoxanthine phosphoribosyltransferase [Merdibacter sp.]